MSSLFSIEAEHSVLGALMFSEKAWDQCGHIVKADDFFRADHRLIFSAIADLARKGLPMDALSVAECLLARGDIEQAGGKDYLGEIAKAMPSITNVAHHAGIIVDRAFYRRVKLAHSAGSEILEDGSRSLQERAREAANLITDALDGADVDAAVPLARDSARDWIDNLERVYSSGSALTGLATGFSDVDQALKGLESGEITIIGARPSMGKSAFALNICANVAATGAGVFISSMEMPMRAIHNRLAAATSRIGYESVRMAKMDEIGPGLTAYAARLTEWKLAVDARPVMDLNRLESSLRHHKRKHGLSLAMVDYLGLMDAGNNPNKANAIADLTRGLKQLAGLLDCPMLVLCQLNRELEKRTDKRPIMADLRDSGAIEQDAHTIMFLYRDFVYNNKTPCPEYTECIISKARDAERGLVIPLHTKLDQMRFGNVDWPSLPPNWRNLK